jgi:hypothetical protein
MLKQVHEHVISELGQSGRTDTIFVVTAIVFNLIVLGINSLVSMAASEANYTLTYDIVLAVFIAMTVLLNILAVAALMVGKRTRQMLIAGLLAMYQDNKVDKYYDAALVTNYATRYFLFIGVILTLATTEIIVPMIIRFS